jgi:hypothetical protein
MAGARNSAARVANLTVRGKGELDLAKLDGNGLIFAKRKGGEGKHKFT